jgi:hypothetical protein
MKKKRKKAISPRQHKSRPNAKRKNFFPPTSQMGVPTFTPWDTTARVARDRDLKALASANLSLVQ